MEHAVSDNDSLIDFLKKAGVLRSRRLEAALRIVDRKNFVPSAYQNLAYENIPLPIAEGQTISQPFTVVFMLELMGPRAGDKVMEVGYGSGWQTALLAEMAGEKGRVHAMELLPSLCKFGKSNVEKYPDYKNRVAFYCQSAARGLPEVAQRIGGFDGIIAAAEVSEVPEEWRAQVRAGGKLIYPKKGSLYREVKRDDGFFSSEEFPGFVFVPFVDT